jgi:phosphatidylserine/phosphatidylglycerophosphate/cardiolipin synthase-like enzyme
VSRWIKAINSAQHYIYIEQQYFISNMGEGAAYNRVAEAVLNALERALDAGTYRKKRSLFPITFS